MQPDAYAVAGRLYLGQGLRLAVGALEQVHDRDLAVAEAEAQLGGRARSARLVHANNHVARPVVRELDRAHHDIRVGTGDDRVEDAGDETERQRLRVPLSRGITDVAHE